MQDAKLREEGIHVGREDVEPNNVAKGHSRTIEHRLEVVERQPELGSQVSGELWFPLRIDRRLACTVELRRVANNRLGLVIPPPPVATTATD